MRRIIYLTLLLTACSGGNGEDSGTVTETAENTGYACIDDDADDNSDSAQVTVMLNECLSGCAADLEASCEATTEGDVVSVTASGSYSVPADQIQAECDDVCIELSANCEADGLAEGDFTLDYAGDTVDFSGPVTEESCTGP